MTTSTESTLTVSSVDMSHLKQSENGLLGRFTTIPKEQLKLLKKLTDMRKKMVSITKQGDNGNYKFATSADVLAVVREQMDKHNVFLMPNVIDKNLQSYALDYATNGKPQRKVTYFTEMWIEYTWIDVDDGGALTTTIYSQGIDVNGEKSVGKAMTYAEKYLMLKTFQIPTDEDPDFINGLDGVRGQRKVTQEQINEVDMMLNTLAKLQGKKHEDMKNFILNVTKGTPLNEVTFEQYEMLTVRLVKAIADEEAKLNGQKNSSQIESQNHGNQNHGLTNQAHVNAPAQQEILELVADNEQIEQITINGCAKINAQRPSLELDTDKGKLLVRDLEAVNRLSEIEMPIVVEGVIQNQSGFKFLVNIQLENLHGANSSVNNVVPITTKSTESSTTNQEKPKGHYNEFAFHSLRVRNKPNSDEIYATVSIGNANTVHCEIKEEIEKLKKLSPLEVFGCEVYQHDNFKFIKGIRSLEAINA